MEDPELPFSNILLQMAFLEQSSCIYISDFLLLSLDSVYSKMSILFFSHNFALKTAEDLF